MHLITNDTLVSILREQIGRNGGPSRYARRLGVSCAFVSAVLNGNKNVSGRILEDLGYERVVGFARIETRAALEHASMSDARGPDFAASRNAVRVKEA